MSQRRTAKEQRRRKRQQDRDVGNAPCADGPTISGSGSGAPLGPVIGETVAGRDLGHVGAAGVTVPMWTVDDALRITARLTDWLGTGDALRLSEWQVWRIVAKELDPRDDEDLTQRARSANQVLAAGLREKDPIWCDPHMVDLLAVAAAELPTDTAMGVQP